MSKTVILVSYYFPPQNEIACHRIGQWAKYLASDGRKVIVITSKKSRLDGTLDLHIDMPDGVDVIEIDFVPKWFINLLYRLRGTPSNGDAASGARKLSLLKIPISLAMKIVYRSLSNLMGTLFDYRNLWAFKAAKALRYLCKSGSDFCVISSYGPASSHLAAYWALRNVEPSIKWIMDFRDPWAGSHITGAHFPFSILEQWMQNSMIRKRAYALTTVSRELQQSFSRQFPAISCRLIQNGIDIAEYRRLGVGVFARDWVTTRAKFPGLGKGEFRIVYTGMIYRGTRNPAPLFRAIRQIRTDFSINITVEFFGKPGDLESVVRSEGAEDFVSHKGLISHHEALQIQSRADLLLVLETDSVNAIGVLTGKIFEYLASGRPVLAVGVDSTSAIGSLLKSTGAGIALGNDVSSIANELSQYLSIQKHPTYTLRVEDLENYSRERQILDLVSLVDHISP